MKTIFDAWNLWEKATLAPHASAELSDAISAIIANESRYLSVSKIIGVPTWVIGALHYRESSFDFKTWLANGDPLTGKTVHMPVGLGPASSWEEGAVISLKHEGWGPGMQWDLANALIHCRDYNGKGYDNRGIESPYIWASTNQYKSGLFTSDGHFDPNKVDHRLGVAAIAIGLKIHGYNLNEVAPA